MKLCVWSQTASGHNRLSEFFFRGEGGVDLTCLLGLCLYHCLPGSHLLSKYPPPPTLACLSCSFPAQMVGLGIFVLGNIFVSWRVSLDFDLVRVTDGLVLVWESAESVLSASGERPQAESLWQSGP